MSQGTILASQMGAGPKFRRITITFADLALISGSGAKPVALFTTQQDSIILGARVKQSVAFAGGSISAMTVSVGKSGSVTFFTAAHDIFAAVADTTVYETALFKHGQKTGLAIIATFTPTGDTVAACTAGSVDIDVYYIDCSTQANPPTAPGTGTPA